MHSSTTYGVCGPNMTVIVHSCRYMYLVDVNSYSINSMNSLIALVLLQQTLL